MEEFFWKNFFGRIFLEEFFRRNFWVDFLGGFFWEEFLCEEFCGRNSLGGILTLLKSAKLFEYGRN